MAESGSKVMAIDSFAGSKCQPPLQSADVLGVSGIDSVLLVLTEKL